MVAEFDVTLLFKKDRTKGAPREMIVLGGSAIWGLKDTNVFFSGRIKNREVTN